MRTLTSKMINTGIKNGFTVKDFCTKYSIAGEMGFLAQLEKAFPNSAAADQALREIRKHEKHRSRRAKKNIENELLISGKEAEVPEKTGLEELKLTEERLSTEVIELENQHKELAGKRRECLRNLRVIQEKVEEIAAELEKQQAAYEETASKSNEIVRQMNQLSTLRAEKLTMLIDTREKIARLEAATIAVYNDGKFEVVDGAAVSLEVNESEVSALTHQLADKEICENLTIKQLKVLSRIFIISNNTALKLEFIFDDSALEQAYLASKPLS